MWSAAILAGGQATRFGGRDKGALLVDGASIRVRQLTVLAQVADDIMIVGPDASMARTARVLEPPIVERQPEEINDPADVPVRTIADRVRGCGPLGGLHAALLDARGDALIVLACDMPFPSAPFLAHLLSLTTEGDAVVPVTARGYHPLCAAYTRACLEPIARRLANRRLTMIGLFEEVHVRAVTAAEMRIFGDPDTLVANVNTPDDYRALEAQQNHEL
jgi:molybdopterin-guanine dinucleotide biosynthesis protein A